jgi:hypothetical protein
MTTDVNPPLDIKGSLADADTVVDALPWRLGATDAQRKRDRGRVSMLAHQIAALLAGGWTVDEVRAALADAPGAVEAPDAAAQERRWRSALKRAKHARRTD